ncbi:MAG TPA: tetratricopeptide repeat protein [Candidatus Deferrimicrobium sp.]|nr:tetratricopeptide repeat protein [Candidatus Deferrimicrobium sp.]
MFDRIAIPAEELMHHLAAQDYPPAVAAARLRAGRHADSVEICQRYLQQFPDCVSARLIFALALLRSGDMESASEQFYQVLSVDPDNEVALKSLADIKYARGDEAAAMANYARILATDPACSGVKSEIPASEASEVRVITLRREPETTVPDAPGKTGRRIPFYSETIGDLYLAQGHSRLAAEVYRVLSERTGHPRLADKLAQAERGSREKE